MIALTTSRDAATHPETAPDRLGVFSATISGPLSEAAQTRSLQR